MRNRGGEDFDGFISGQNIDFELVERLLKKGWGAEECRSFLERARTFVDATKEQNFIDLLNRMLIAFDRDFPTVITKVEKVSIEEEASEEGNG